MIACFVCFVQSKAGYQAAATSDKGVAPHGKPKKTKKDKKEELERLKREVEMVGSQRFASRLKCRTLKPIARAC